MDLSLYLDTTQAARLLSLSRAQVSALCKRGTLASERVGRNYLILRRDLDSYLSAPQRKFAPQTKNIGRYARKKKAKPAKKQGKIKRFAA